MIGNMIGGGTNSIEPHAGTIIAMKMCRINVHICEQKHCSKITLHIILEGEFYSTP